MYPAMIAFGLAGIMICIGMVLRAKIPFLRKMYVPVCIIAGILGFIFMNVVPNDYLYGADSDMFSTLVDILFTLSFICISLIDNPKEEKAEDDAPEYEVLPNGKKKKKKKKKSSGIFRGALGMALIWCALYSITPVLGYYLIKLIGSPFNMSAELGILIPFAFCQGPGQAVTYGSMFESQYGVANAIQVALAFAAIGFIAAFLVGVPLAKRAIKSGAAKHIDAGDPAIEKGFYSSEEQTESIGKVTTHSGSIDTLACHFAIVGMTYILALGVSYVLDLIPSIGSSFSSMMFFCGMIAAYIVKFALKKLKIYHILDVGMLNRLVGWLTDFLVVMAFMSVELNIIGSMIVPLLIEAVIVTIITFAVCVYFGKRLGGQNDLERTLGLYGSATGTIPSGIALIRIVDPKLSTPTNVELGLMNALLILCSPTMILVILGMTGSIPLQTALLLCLAIGIIYLILLKPLGIWRKPSYSFKKGVLNAAAAEVEPDSSAESAEAAVVEASVVDAPVVEATVVETAETDAASEDSAPASATAADSSEGNPSESDPS